MGNLSISQAFKKLGLITLLDAKKLGLTNHFFYKLVREDKLRLLEHGVYEVLASNISSEDLAFAKACKLTEPVGVIGGLSALFYYQLLDQAPLQTWVLCPLSKKVHRESLKIVRTKLPLDTFVEKKPFFKIVTLERSIIDAFYFHSEIGEATALKAALLAIRENRTTLQKLFKVAKTLGVENYLLKHITALSLERDF